jgi:aspartyl-tRNA(Asn)/glutamyl-tRNA(Gln) amidotransferase subunit A
MTSALNFQPLTTLAHSLESGTVSSVALVEDALALAHDASGQGSRIYTQLFESQALDAARASDLLRGAGLKRSALEGLVISVKDLFDVSGHVTRAGSVVLADAAPAKRDAVIIERLRAAGTIVLGSTNMTEFAFSGLGLNPHYGTPLGPFERSAGRIPGGSSSGAAVSVSDGMASAAIGTDTGGSVRRPAAFCGLTGYKPTAARIPRQGLVPLSLSLDSIGPIGHRVTCCAWLDAIMSGEPVATIRNRSVSSLVLAKPRQVVFDQVEPIVMQAFVQACEALQQAGAKIIEIDVPELSEWQSIHAKSGLAATEAWAWHQNYVRDHAQHYDPRVLLRLQGGESVLASAYIDALSRRQDWISRLNARTNAFDAMIYPTVAVIPPLLAPLIESDELYSQINALVLRNTAIMNYFDACSLSLPCHVPGQAPVGLMLSAQAGKDKHLIEIGLACENILNRLRGVQP